VRFRALLITLAVAAGGCGVPGSVSKQAEDVASIAAEGSVLAGEVAGGDSTSPFVETHARALGKKAETLTAGVSQPDLLQVARGVVAELMRLASAPGDRAAARVIERRLEQAASRAEEIGQAAS
jgi:hypothetical protein